MKRMLMGLLSFSKVTSKMMIVMLNIIRYALNMIGFTFIIIKCMKYYTKS